MCGCVSKNTKVGLDELGLFHLWKDPNGFNQQISAHFPRLCIRFTLFTVSFVGEHCIRVALFHNYSLACQHNVHLSASSMAAPAKLSSCLVKQRKEQSEQALLGSC